MKFAKVVMIVAVLCLMAVAGVGAQTKGNATAEVTALLREFMAGAGSGDRAIFEKFFADDVIYTRATGVVITKARHYEEPWEASASLGREEQLLGGRYYGSRVRRHCDCGVPAGGPNGS